VSVSFRSGGHGALEAAESLAAFMDHFKGVKIISTDPLVIETYDDLWYLDAEWIPTTWWPNYGYGVAPWHTIVPGWLAEAEKRSPPFA
jgi:peptide/nickel transport system substrate-binding protein